jgi:ferredoxin
MSGNGMTGARAFRKFNILFPKKKFFTWLDSLASTHQLIGPVTEGTRTAFEKVRSSKDLAMEYSSTMLSPGKQFIYTPRQDLFTFRDKKGRLSVFEVPVYSGTQILVGVHPCDTHALLYLDSTFLGRYKDPYYAQRRKHTFIISLNCEKVSPNCFCSSLGTGPFLEGDEGCDMLLTNFGDDYLVEIRSNRAMKMFRHRGIRAGKREMKQKQEKEAVIEGKMRKTIDIKNLDKLFLAHKDHPVWQHTADSRCLSCSNCVLVCPTCFCYEVVDDTSVDLQTVTRYRHLDACQDLRFSEVHGGNFRQQRMARLRQFVTHKLDQTFQYGVPGTVGCGRCITWCPTSIDLTEIAKEIQKG